MTKSRSPFEVKTGGGLVRKAVGVVIVLAALWLTVKFPGELAATVKHAGHVAAVLIDGVGSFLHEMLR